MDKYLAYVFEDRANAELAYEKAISHGYKPKDITVLMSKKTKKHYFRSPLVNEVEKNELKIIAKDGLIGGIIGAALGALIGVIVNIAVPKLGLVIAGPLAVVGFLAGGLMGGLTGIGIPEKSNQLFEDIIKTGAVVLIVKKNKKSDGLEKDWDSIKE